MIADPAARGRALARFHAEQSAHLLRDLEEARLAPGDDPARVALEWECFTLYACVRGLIAAGGFNRETAAAIDALHEAALGEEAAPDHRARIAERYAEYGAIGQRAETEGEESVARRLGEAAARHLCGGGEPSPDLAETVGGLHEALAAGAAEAVRREEGA